jgi:hypothetical protein
MSQEALIAPKGFRHLPRHDLESVYYVAIILGCLQDDGTIPPVLHAKWTEGPLEDIGDKKGASILGRSDVLQQLQPHHQVLKGHLKDFFRTLLHFDLDEQPYDKSVEDQAAEDSLLDDQLTKLESLAESIRGEW